LWQGAALAGSAQALHHCALYCRFAHLEPFDGPGEATTDIPAAAEDLARTHDCTLIDVSRLFSARSPDGLTGSGLFWDDLHPCRQGRALIAEALLPVVGEAVP